MGIPRKMNKAIFIDRDGTLNVKGEHTAPLTIEEFKLVNGALYFIMYMKSLGYYNLVVTNQPDIARGNLTRDTLDDMHNTLLNALLVDDVFVCPHDDSDNCNCRKPKTGLIDEAVKKYNIDVKKSFVVGDTWRDMELADNVGCRGILIDTSYNEEVYPISYIRVLNLYHASSVIENIRGGK